MFGGAVQDHLGRFLSHEFKVGGDGGNTIQDDLLQRCFIVGDHAHMFTHFHFCHEYLLDQGHQVFLHQVDKDFAFLDRFFGDIMYDTVIERILAAEFGKTLDRKSVV